jgi:outer membrane protein W
LGVLTGVVVLGSVSTAQAAEGFELGARVGYGIPMGKVNDDGTNDKLSQAISGMVPLQLDLGYRVIPNLMVGAYFMYGIGFAGDTITKLCDQAKAGGIDATCSAHDVRLGAQVQYHISPDGQIDPWLGAGIGYEWLTFGFEGAGTTISSTGHGFEFINLQGGADFSVAPNFGLGPFLSLSVGQYSKASGDCSGNCGGITTSSEEIDKKAMHEWLTLGVRGTFVL